MNEIVVFFFNILINFSNGKGIEPKGKSRAKLACNLRLCCCISMCRHAHDEQK